MKTLVDSFAAAEPHGDLAEQLVSLLTPECAAADRYRALRYTIEALRSDARLPTVAVTSPDAGDGKTVTVLNLAGAFAQAEGARVLVVDSDLRKPSVSNYLVQPLDRARGAAYGGTGRTAQFPRPGRLDSRSSPHLRLCADRHAARAAA
jgi:Mrp family chromosome partitioning ATPase